MTNLLPPELTQERHLLPKNATVPEKALAALGPLVHELDDPISRMWDAWTCPTAALPWLAWAVRVPLWDETWPETKQRAVIAESPELNSVKGSVYAVSRYLEIMDGRLVDFMLPPSGIYLSAGPTEEEARRWREAFAEIRIYDRPGADTIAWDFLGEGYFDDAGGEAGFYLAAYAPRPKRRAELHDGGTVLDLEVVEARYAGDGSTRIVETLFGSGIDAGGFYLDEACFDDFLMPASPVLFLTMVNGQPQGRAGVDARLISDIPERVVLTGVQEDFYLGDGIVDVGFLEPSIADRMIYESFRLFDPARSAGAREGGFCFGDDDVFDLPPHHMLIDIDATFPLDRQAMFLGGFDGDYLMPDDGRHRQRLFDAAAAANPTSDRTLASTIIYRPVRFSDGLPFGSFTFGDMINSKELSNA